MGKLKKNVKMNQKETLKEARKTLKKIFRKYHNKGMDSIFLWGSIINKDFDLKSSDVDSIAIVNNKLDLKKEKKIIWELKKISPEIKNFKIRFVYIDELNNKGKKGSLTKYITPEQLIYDMKNWEYVVGIKYSEKSFSLKPNISRIIKTLEKKIKNMKSKKDEVYKKKAILRLIYYKEQLGGNNFPYSRNNLINKVKGKNKFLIQKLIK